MIKTNERHAETEEEHTDRFPADIETLKQNFARLREDMSRLLQDTVGTSRSGAGFLKDRSAQTVEMVGQKIGERPLLSAAIALGIGFILAKIITSRR